MNNDINRVRAGSMRGPLTTGATPQFDKINPPYSTGRPQSGRGARFEITLTLATLIFTTVMGTLLAIALAGILRACIERGDVAGLLGEIVFVVIVALLMWGNVLYQLTRLALFRRSLNHRPAPALVLEEFYHTDAPALTVLVPSYKEEPEVVQRTLLSAALQDYPHRRVVLLIDDPVECANPGEERALRRIEFLPARLQALFDDAAARFASECAAYECLRSSGTIDVPAEAQRIVDLYESAAQWLEEQTTHLNRAEAGDELLRERVFLPLAQGYRARGQQVVSSTRDGTFARAHLVREYRRIASLFRVEFTSFQRKRYVNLAHEPNKAMNLNAYIGLMGGHFREVWRSDGLHLEACAGDGATLHVPDAELLLTLDADSIIVPDYALRLAYYLSLPGNERVAVAQTPYSTIPAATGTLESVAGATTDVQYNIHQGFTAFEATYWVGANALLRKRALEDIARAGFERGFPVQRFIHDRTVIEDTESSVDLVTRGWRLYNYPARLAYSATPPDFGALLIQRRRWANGGLIILPKLLRYLVRGPSRMRKAAEGFFRCHYLVSIAAVNVGLLVMLAGPYEQSLRIVWLPLAAAPYFLLYARDLAQAGYRYSDVLRVYALNLMLVPVNLGGVLLSLRQAITGRKAAFGRTPKVAGRTAVPAVYLLAEYGLLVWWLTAAIRDFLHAHYAHFVFTVINAGLLSYAVHRYIGWRTSGEDLRNAFARASTRSDAAEANGLSRPASDPRS